ncbi:hypothetical protein HF520_06590 [Romboutsia sp. CE17]|uniref:hypothetical protein n=1 Tax=Romboutsia sp. CE17 TaxID=2724150 RepID=UPI001442C1AD|nr:hypothetical protein [Romboutsia sp. CE17]QJA08627.1 hypothetical protein HF520_06590 [Romboutsia sp. CE17]
MKKIIVLFAILICIFSSGCSKQEERKVESLEDAYFYAVEKVESKEEIKIEDIKELLKEYKFELIDMSENSGSKQDIKKYAYSFSNDKREKLVIFTKKNNNNETEIIGNINYLIEEDKNSNETPFRIYLSYENIDNLDEFTIDFNTYDITNLKKLSKVIYNKDSLFLNTYNKIIENMCTTNDLTLKDIEKIINMKPISDSHLESFSDIKSDKLEISRDTYKNDFEELSINYINDKDKIGRVLYTKSDTKTDIDYNLTLIKSAYIENINDNKINFSIGGNVNSLSVQEKFLDLALKK